MQNILNPRRIFFEEVEALSFLPYSSFLPRVIYADNLSLVTDD